VWAMTLVIGFTVWYFVAFHIRNPQVAIGLLLLCKVPFWTSNIIRMISWIRCSANTACSIAHFLRSTW
jgi:putative spermidine/putrescine transport system permease protein